MEQEDEDQNDDDGDENESEGLNGSCKAKTLGGRQENSLRTVR